MLPRIVTDIVRRVYCAPVIAVLALALAPANAAIAFEKIDPVVEGTAQVVLIEGGSDPFSDIAAVIGSGLTSSTIAVTPTTQAAVLAAADIETGQISPQFTFFVAEETASPQDPPLLSGNLVELAFADDIVELLFQTDQANSSAGSLFPLGFLVTITALQTSFGLDLIGTAAASQDPLEVAIEVSNVAPIPVPASALLMACALGGGALRRRMMRR